MKKIFTATLSFLSAFTFAQGPKNIVLTKGQEIEISTTNSSQSEMGMGMTMNNNTASTSKLVVVNEDENTYTLTNTLTKMKVTMEGMGQSTEFDSDKAEDKDSEMGKVLGGKINKADTYILNKTTGKITASKTNEAEETAGGGMIATGMSSADESNGTGDAFLIISSDKSVGDTWNETVSNKGITTKKTYKIVSIANDIANVEIKGTITGTTEQEMQGNTIKMKTDAKLEGKITSNVKTGLVYMIKMDADVSGTVEAMGQEMPVSTKSSTTTLFNQ